MIVAIGNDTIRQRLFLSLLRQGERFVTARHPSAIIAPDVYKGAPVAPFCVYVTMGVAGADKLRLDERRQEKPGHIAAFEQLAAKAAAVTADYPDTEIVLLLITHHAHPGVLEAARERGIIVVQSFER